MELKCLSIITNFGCHYKCPYCIVKKNGINIPKTTVKSLDTLLETYKSGGYDYIEFQGRQHIEGFDTEVFSNASPLEVIQERDNIKREFCKKHNIKLIEIPYSKKGRIKIEDLLI